MAIGWATAARVHDAPWIQGDNYYRAGTFVDVRQGLQGNYLVLVQYRDADYAHEWHLDQDLVFALRLKRERDSWVRPDEDYVQVARLERDRVGKPALLEIRAEHLSDYLCARESGLLVATFRSRRIVCPDKPPLSWDGARIERDIDGGSWVGTLAATDERGAPFGSQTLVLKASRHDETLEDDVPVLKRSGEQKLETATATLPGGSIRVFMASGEMWRNEWVPPGGHSPRVRGDEVESTIPFIIEADGQTAIGSAISYDIRWLWFDARIILDVLNRRGGSLGWFTEDTGSVGLASHSSLPFGVNDIGLVNVFAKDIVELPQHAQRIWSARNLAPDGGVCRELISAQMECSPASTIAPEVAFRRALDDLDGTSESCFGKPLLRPHHVLEDLLCAVHRFKAAEPGGLFLLCKEITRVVVDRLDSTVLNSIHPQRDKKLGAIKRLERLLTSVGRDGRTIVAPLVGVYELRHADAHLPSADLTSSMALLGIDDKQDTVAVGKAVILRVAESVSQTTAVLPEVAEARRQ